MSVQEVSRVSGGMSENSKRYYEVAGDYYSRIGDRTDKKTGEMPFSEAPDSESHLFTIEEKQSARLLNKCAEYMPEEEFALVCSALALSLFAHQNQYRDSNEPYSVHSLAVTIELVEECKQDAVTIASSLLHDVVEDTPVTLEIIKKATSEEVAETVNGLSRIRGRFLRKEIVKEESRMKILHSLLSNPRIAIIKIFDRLCNLRTLKTKKGRAKRLVIIQETEQVYLPLARILGLHRQADELDDLCLVHLSKKHEEFAGEIKRKREEYFRLHDPQEITDFLLSLLNGQSVKAQYRLPTLNDIYGRIGEVREIRDSDLCLNIDIVMEENAEGNSAESWAEAACRKAEEVFAGCDKYQMTGFNKDEFLAEVNEGWTDSLTVYLQGKENGTKIKVNFFPKDVYEREQIPLTGLYFQRPPLDSDMTADVLQKEDEAGRRHHYAFKKLSFLQERYLDVLDQYNGNGRNVDSAKIVRRLIPRPPEGHVVVVGEDDQGEKRLWTIKNGATVMDFAEDIAHSHWPTVASATLNGKKVPLNHVIQAGDRVHINFDPKGKTCWNPFRIHCFDTSFQASETVRRRVKKMIKLEEKAGVGTTREKVIKIGKWRLKKELGLVEENWPGSLGKIMNVVTQMIPQITPEEFLFMAGLKEFPEEIEDIEGMMREIKKLLKE